MTSRAPFHHRGLAAAATPTAPQHTTGTGHTMPDQSHGSIALVAALFFPRVAG